MNRINMRAMEWNMDFVQVNLFDILLWALPLIITIISLVVIFKKMFRIYKNVTMKSTPLAYTTKYRENLEYSFILRYSLVILYSPYIGQLIKNLIIFYFYTHVHIDNFIWGYFAVTAFLGEWLLTFVFMFVALFLFNFIMLKLKVVRQKRFMEIALLLIALFLMFLSYHFVIDFIKCIKLIL